MVLLLLPQDVKGLLTIGEACDAMETGFRDWAKNRWLGELRQRVHTPENVRLTVHIGSSTTASALGVYVHPERVAIDEAGRQSYAARGDRVRIVYASETGQLQSIQIGEMEVSELPGVNPNVVIPTACASVVGTRLLSRPDSKVVGILGSRGQAKAQLAGLKYLMPDLEQAIVFSPSPDNRQKFAEQMGPLTAMDVVVADSAEQVARAADILLTATNSNVPTFDGEWLRPGTHVTSLVSSNKGLHEGGFIRKARREVDDRTLQRADIVMCNSVDQEVLDRTAVVWQTCEDGVISWDKVTDMGRIMAGESPGRTSADQVTFFKQNAFWGVGDQAIGRALYAKAVKKGIGMKLDISGFESQTDSSLEG